MLSIFIISTIWVVFSIVEHQKNGISNFSVFSAISVISSNYYFISQPWLWIVLLCVYFLTLVYLSSFNVKTIEKDGK